MYPTLGIPDDTIQKGRDYKQVTEVVQNGNDFTWTQFYPSNHKVTNTFSIGKEADMQTISGKKFKVGKDLWFPNIASISNQDELSSHRQTCNRTFPFYYNNNLFLLLKDGKLMEPIIINDFQHLCSG